MVGFDEKNTFQEAQGLISKRKKKKEKKTTATKAECEQYEPYWSK